MRLNNPDFVGCKNFANSGSEISLVLSKKAGSVFISFAFNKSFTHLSAKSTSSNFAPFKNGSCFNCHRIAAVGHTSSLHLLSPTIFTITFEAFIPVPDAVGVEVLVISTHWLLKIML